ncbi:MAG: hypothetical protein WAO35_20145 [Terriglobia bacterium]
MLVRLLGPLSTIQRELDRYLNLLVRAILWEFPATYGIFHGCTQYGVPSLVCKIGRTSIRVNLNFEGNNTLDVSQSRKGRILWQSEHLWADGHTRKQSHTRKRWADLSGTIQGRRPVRGTLKQVIVIAFAQVAKSLRIYVF